MIETAGSGYLIVLLSGFWSLFFAVYTGVTHGS